MPPDDAGCRKTKEAARPGDFLQTQNINNQIYNANFGNWQPVGGVASRIAVRIARRFSMPISTAQTIVELAGIGEVTR